MVQLFQEGKILYFLISLLNLLTMSKCSTKPLETIASSSHHFSVKLYKLLREESGNIIVSPTSLEVVLALACTGARGETAKEILSGLELPNDTDVIKNGYNAVMTNLRSTDDMILELANKIYSERTFSLQQEFQLVAEKSFLAAAESVDFLRNSENTRISMNSWVEKQTHDKIKDLFSQGDITTDTKMVLINAVYFKGKWKHPFNPARTLKEPFHISASETKEVDMMHIKAKFGYSELDSLKAKMLVMPYVGDKMFMVILLPNEIDGLQEMEKKLNTLNIIELTKKTDHLEVNVALPRFKIEKTIDLKEKLEKLGITSMFDPLRADFSGISKENGLYVSKVVQKAFIEVNEEGSEAAAATGMAVMLCSLVIEPEPKVFKADHSFMFFLVNKDVNIALFQGAVSSF